MSGEKWRISENQRKFAKKPELENKKRNEEKSANLSENREELPKLLVISTSEEACKKFAKFAKTAKICENLQKSKKRQNKAK